MIHRYLIYGQWLKTYITGEHYQLCRHLSTLGWHLVEHTESQKIETIVSHPNIVFFVTYGAIDLSQLKICSDAYIIYKFDDQHDPNDLIGQHCCQVANLIVSPYAYLLSSIVSRKKFWLPYSCVDHDLKDLKYNHAPIARIFVSGCLNPDFYPFRHYVTNLHDSRIEYLPHPGYHEQSQRIIGQQYLQRINGYLCGFTDASKFRYLLLKNFEIAATGSLLLTDTSIEPEMNKIGFYNHEHCIFCRQETFLDKVTWILNPINRERVDKIRRRGMDLVRHHHLTSLRAKTFNHMVDELNLD
jgi:hypothetical protein